MQHILTSKQKYFIFVLKYRKNLFPVILECTHSILLHYKIQKNYVVLKVLYNSYIMFIIVLYNSYVILLLHYYYDKIIWLYIVIIFTKV